MLRRGRSGFAVLGVNPQETQSSIDAALTFGILWLDACRLAQVGKVMVEGLKLFLPAATSELTREGMAHLHPGAAKWQLYELESREGRLREIEVSDRGNVRTRLVHWTDEAQARERFAAAIDRVRELMPEAEMAVISPAEIAFRCHGLEFAKARLAHQPGALCPTAEILFGVGADQRCSGSRMQMPSGALCTAWERCATLRVREIMRCGGCTPSAGWSLWWCRICPRWTSASMPSACIPRCRHSRPRTAP